MVQKTDLYSILVAYANKYNSPYIEIDSFLDFLGRYAKKQSEEQPEWNKWVLDRTVKFWADLSVLAEESKCELLTDSDNGRIYMPQFYMDLLAKSYQKGDEDADLPFPCEESMRITLPENQTRPMNCDYDLAAYLDDPQDSDIPLLKIIFPNDAGNALALASMVPRQIIEMALLKVRNYLRKGGNKEYSLRKLTVQLQGKEPILRDQLNQVLTRPIECYNSIKDGGDVSYLFWAHFCILIKNDIKKKKERLNEDIAVFQSAFLIETINSYFKNLAVKKREAELAFLSLENHLSKPPFIYTLDQIIKFTNSKGVLLLGQYTEEELQEWIGKKTTESTNNELPVLLVIMDPDDERFFLLKDKMLPLCTRLLSDARIKVKNEISRQWRKLLIEFEKEPAMESDEEFERILAVSTAKLCPLLSALLNDTKLLLVYEEMERSRDGIPLAIRIFNKGNLVPYASLLLINRKEVLADAKLILPIWHFIPIISSIIAFFRKLSKRKKAPKIYQGGAMDDEQNITGAKDHAGEIRDAAEELELSLVPSGHTLDSYLEELEGRWSRLIDRQARENLIVDVKSLIRDNLRQNLKLQKKFKISGEIISQMANNIVIRTPALSSLNGRDSLILYSQLYLIKLLENIK